MQLKRLLGVAAMTLLFSAPANATVILFDDFNGENGGVGALNYNSFGNFTVSGGTVDLIGNGFYDFLPGNGLYVDTDGSTGNAGIMSTAMFNVQPGVVRLAADLAGSHRPAYGLADSVLFTIYSLANPLGFSALFTIPHNAPFGEASLAVLFNSADTVGFRIEGIGNDNVGVLVDNVRLEATVPEPGALLLLATGLAGAYRRFRPRG